MFRYLCVRLTEVEAVNVRMAAHREVYSHRILLVACHVIKDKNRIWARLTRWNDVVGERIVVDFVDRRKQIFWISILWLFQRFRIDVHVLETCVSGSRVELMRTLILPQFDGPQMIACIVLGSISPCLRFSALPPIIRDFASQFVMRIVSGCSTNFMLTLQVVRSRRTI